MLAIEWPRILDYIGAKNSALVRSFRGVSRQDIEQCKARYSVALPASYVDFLLIMGEDSGDLGPLGATQSHRFSEMMSRFPPTGYPADRLFKVSYETDDSALAFLDKFLDLTHADAQDAQLVEFESGDAGAPVDPGDFTFGESVVRDIFGGLELYQRSYAATAFLYSEDGDHRLAVKRSSMELLTRLGLGLVMPGLERVACLSRDPLSTMVSVYDSTQGVDIRIGCDDLRALEGFVEDLVANLPGASLVQAPFEQRQ